MKKLLMTLALAVLLAPALSAQRGGDGGEAGEPGGQVLSAAERLAELHRLMRRAGEEMDKLERELARASLGSPRPDVVAERIQRMRTALEQGRLDDLPPGLVEYLRRNADDVAGQTELSVDEVLRLIREHQESEATPDESTERALSELEQLLERNPELLRRLAGSEEAMEEVTRHQHEAERRLEESLRRQREASESARVRVDEAIEYAHTLRGG
jgi:hypothetical protein